MLNGLSLKCCIQYHASVAGCVLEEACAECCSACAMKVLSIMRTVCMHLRSHACSAVAAGSVILASNWIVPSHRGLCQYHLPAKPHCLSRQPQLHSHAPKLRDPGCHNAAQSHLLSRSNSLASMSGSPSLQCATAEHVHVCALHAGQLLHVI